MCNTRSSESSAHNITSAEVAEMNNDELLDHFMNITGYTYLSCKHCHCLTVPLSAFVMVIRKRCLKKNAGGLYNKMNIPKTCDIQSAANLKRQPYYTKIKNAVSIEDIDQLKTVNSDLFVTTRKKYVRRSAAKLSVVETAPSLAAPAPSLAVPAPYLANPVKLPPRNKKYILRIVEPANN